MIKKILKQLNLQKFRTTLIEISKEENDELMILDFQQYVLHFAIHDKIIMSRPEYSFFRHLLADLDTYIIDCIESTGDSYVIDSYVERARDEEKNNKKKEKKRISELVFLGRYINQDINMIRFNKIAPIESIGAVIRKNIKKYLRYI